MPSFKTSAVVSALAGAATVMAHGHVNYFTVDGKYYQGYDVTSYPYQASPPEVYGWSATNTDNGFVDATSYSSGDIICHKGAKNAALTATAAPGSKVEIFWDTWPESHKGPVIDYLAPCGSDCSTVDKASLEFFKIQEQGKIDDSLQNGKWASDVLIANNNSWTLTIPKNVKAGKYVLRHEIIALHAAGQENGAQNYPQCFNLEITGSGSEAPAGTLGTALYKANDAGILVSIYNNLKSYVIPGPKIDSAFSSGSGSDSGSDSPAPSATAPAASATAPAASASAPAVTSAAPAATTSAAAAPAVTSAAAAQPTGGASKPTCEEKRRRRLARRMERQHARDVVRRN
ncbi:Endoglucanase-4-like protein 1 [Colletotrichum truncatum]|uniref:Endoglucanase-4-like protein 1 n=1 Tax=Colletotrichum truncatum TaxID=5467 RepID=A0ACC3ZF11_COLTU|nr:Endoglucanase-4-like protein 1 [Colletotrichum truncatum]KAF6801633.1 Endoglucanase-4-like protein 1 [Colletotrichum truncatum]